MLTHHRPNIAFVRTSGIPVLLFGVQSVLWYRIPLRLLQQASQFRKTPLQISHKHVPAGQCFRTYLRAVLQTSPDWRSLRPVRRVRTEERDFLKRRDIEGVFTSSFWKNERIFSKVNELFAGWCTPRTKVWTAGVLCKKLELNTPLASVYCRLCFFLSCIGGSNIVFMPL